MILHWEFGEMGNQKHTLLMDMGVMTLDLSSVMCVRLDVDFSFFFSSSSHRGTTINGDLYFYYGSASFTFYKRSHQAQVCLMQSMRKTIDNPYAQNIQWTFICVGYMLQPPSVLSFREIVKSDFVIRMRRKHTPIIISLTKWEIIIDVSGNSSWHKSWDTQKENHLRHTNKGQICFTLHNSKRR